MNKIEQFADAIATLTREAGSKEEAALAIMSYLAGNYYVLDVDYIVDDDDFFYNNDIFHEDNETTEHLEEALGSKPDYKEEE